MSLTMRQGPVPATRPRVGAPVTEAADYLQHHRGVMLDRLAEWVRIPSVAADPERAVEVVRSAHWLAAEMRAHGLSTTLYPTGDSVAVYGEWLVDPALPTVLVYSHHDVRHAKPDEWSETDPFTPVLRDGRLYGRGASDAKGQVMAHLWGLAAHLHAPGRHSPAVNLKLLVEGEEESGSPHLSALLEQEKERFACDLVVFSDTLQWKEHAPAAVTSMRGMVSASLTITGPRRDVHSGAASGTTANPLHVLADLLSALHDESGRITLPGFYDPVATPSEARRQELRELPFDADTWTERTETRAITGEAGFTPLERLWLRPSLEVLSLLAGDPEGIARAVIPSRAQATLNIRTVPGQRVAEVAAQLRSFVEQRVPATVSYTLELDEETGQEPYVTPDGPALGALKRALASGFGREAVGSMGNAGGGPADLLAETLGTEVVFLGTGLPEDHWHASDESIDVEMLERGAATIAYLWDELGRVLPE